MPTFTVERCFAAPVPAVYAGVLREKQRSGASEEVISNGTGGVAFSNNIEVPASIAAVSGSKAGSQVSTSERLVFDGVSVTVESYGWLGDIASFSATGAYLPKSTTQTFARLDISIDLCSMDKNGGTYAIAIAVVETAARAWIASYFDRVSAQAGMAV